MRPETKVAVILRGIPGSGKSTVATYLKNRYEAKVYSTDSYHIKDGTYKYDTERAAEFHASNLKAFEYACAAENQMVVVDNTNIWPHYYLPYTEFARECGYVILQIKLKNASRVSIHSVPQGVVDNMSIALKKYWKMRNPDYTIMIPAEASMEWIKKKIQRTLNKIEREVF